MTINHIIKLIGTLYLNNILLQTNTNEKVAIYYIKIALIKKNKTKYHYILTNYSPIRILIFIFKLEN